MKASKNNELDNKYPIPVDVIDIVEEAGEALVNIGGYDKAIETGIAVLDKYPNHPRLLNFVGKVHYSGGNFTSAEEYYLRAITEAPDFALAYSNLSLLYSKIDDLEKAERFARRSIKLFKASAIPWNTLGICFAKKGETRRALEHFLAAYGYDSNFTKAAYNIACCYSILNEPEKALEYLALSLDSPKLIELAEEDSEFDSIRILPKFKEIINEARASIVNRKDN